MPPTNSEIRSLIKSAQFNELFLALGWDHVPASQHFSVSISDREFDFLPVSQKRGFVVLLHESDSVESIPDRATGLRIENKLTRLAAEHLLIFTDKSRTRQVWQWSRRSAGSPTRIIRETYFSGSTGERLFQRVSKLFFSLSEEDDLTITDVSRRAEAQFREKITKRFYDKFKTEHEKFSKQIEGIADRIQRDRFTSLTLNRLMFVYFVQSKGFLNNDPAYLRTKLTETQQQVGRDMFYAFYDTFLARFFHEGLGEAERAPELVALIGKVPYLNGGLFDRHSVETKYSISIKDEAFEKIFDFFDNYDWHLDDRPLRDDRHINPEVLGYIFEKFINQKQMGAYYTKEDITEYISKNTIIPFLFDRVKEKVNIAFHAQDGIWKLLREDPDRYIYDAVRKGVVDEDGNIIEVPANIAAGIGNVEQRTGWNRTADSEFGLPTETWREYMARRQRCLEIREKLSDGEIHDINDLITYNLDIRLFAEDVIFTTESSDLVKAFYHAIAGRIPEKSNERFEHGITVLDPTCGSGAFLFAALKILEPLISACLDRIEDFVEDEDRLRSDSKKFASFRRVLDEAAKHPNEKYFILKSIIVNNLFGVDIMPDAVEICKLRLFLTLVAEVEPDPHRENLGLEPLPDIDFNIRSGNTLVGFATEKQVYAAFQGAEHGQGRFDYDNRADDFKWRAEHTASQFEQFRRQQTEAGGEISHDDKVKLASQLRGLSDELDIYTAHEYGIKETDKDKFVEFLTSHQPFHWYSEFYSIIVNGGFDVLIGNPPYVEYSQIRSSYTVPTDQYQSLEGGNLYAFVMERSLLLLRTSGRLGFIVPISLTCTQRMSRLQDIVLSESSLVWNSIYAERPDRLFIGAEVLLTISLLHKLPEDQAGLLTTGLRKWKSEERPHLFASTSYIRSTDRLRNYVLPKISSERELSIIHKVFGGSVPLGTLFRAGGQNRIYYRIGGGRYWKVFTTFQPKFVLNGTPSVSSRESYLFFDSIQERDCAVAILSSSLFYWYFVLTTNGRDLNPSDLKLFPLPNTGINSDTRSRLSSLSSKLMADYRIHKQEKEKNSRQTGHILYEEFYPRKSKAILDQIDILLAESYGLTDVELDFIINFDIKYRMGAEEN